MYVSNFNGGANELWKNDGRGVFTAVSGPTTTAENTSTAVWGDADGDGDLDLFLANDGADDLFMNDGTGSFSARTQVHNLPYQGGHHLQRSTTALFGDVDGDGDVSPPRLEPMASSAAHGLLARSEPPTVDSSTCSWAATATTSS